MECLNINKYLMNMVPLHLQLYEIDLDKKYKKQRVSFKTQVPLQPYFVQTLKNLALNIPKEDIVNSTPPNSITDSTKTKQLTN